MKKKALGIAAIVLVLIGTGWGVRWLSSNRTVSSGEHGAPDKAKVVDVEDVVNSPENFPGLIGVEGTVATVDEKNVAFTLGCEDACIAMPVRFRGRLPKEGATVIAYGEVQKTEDAKYVFVAREIEAK